MDNAQRNNGLSNKAMNYRTFDPNKERTAEHMSEIYEIQLNQMNMVSESLCNGNGNDNHVAIMVDSGASKSLISTNCIERSPYLRKLKKMPVANIKFQTNSDGHCIDAVYVITFNFTI